MNARWWLLMLLIATGAIQAESAHNPVEPGAVPEVEAGEVIEPDITIIEQEDETVRQYSINGRVYMVQIIPAAGPSYYLLDLDGDGVMDVRRDGPDDIAVPQWVIFRW